MAERNGPQVIRPGGQATEAIGQEEPKPSDKDSSVILKVEGQPEGVKPTAIDVSAETTPKVSYYKKKKLRQKASAEGAAAVIVIMFDSLVGQAFGDECRMTAYEKEMILEPLARIMERLDHKTTKAVEKWTDPILLAMGMAAWIGRIYRIQADQRDDDEGGEDDIEPAKGPRDDGREIEEPVIRGKDNVAAVGRTIAEVIGASEGIEVG